MIRVNRPCRSRRILALAGVVVLAGSASAACGSSSSAGTSSESAKTVKVGLIDPLTGPVASVGVEAENAAKAAVAYINANGGLSGQKVELIVRDDKADPTTATADARILVQQGIKALIGPDIGGDVEAAAAITDAAGIPLFTAAADTELSDASKYPLVFVDGLTIPAMAGRWISATENAASGKPIGALVLSDGQQTDFIAGLNQAASSAGVRVDVEQIDPTATDDSPQISKLKSAGVGALIVEAFGSPLVTILNDLQTAGWYPPVVGLPGLGDSSVVKSASPQVMANASALVGKSFVAPTASSTLEDYLNELVAVAGKGSLDGVQLNGVYDYDGLMVLRAGVLKSRSLDGKAIASALESGMTVQGAQGSFAYTSTSHQGLSSAQLGLFSAVKGCPRLCVPAVGT